MNRQVSHRRQDALVPAANMVHAMSNALIGFGIGGGYSGRQPMSGTAVLAARLVDLQ
jgi:hypothetical protein